MFIIVRCKIPGRGDGMKKGAWKKKIIDNMKAVGTYQDAYMSAIETLADILARRDAALKQWTDEGCQLTIVKTLDRGAQNMAKNPLLAILQECERDALTYWGQLGLTPSGLKKAFSEEKESVRTSMLAKALKDLTS